MTGEAIQPWRREAARIAGAAYLFNFAASGSEIYIRSLFTVSGDVAAAADSIAASETLARIAIVSGVVTASGFIVLTAALFVLLQPVSRTFAATAAFWNLAVVAIGSAAALRSFTVISLAGGPAPFGDAQLQALRVEFETQAAGGSVALVFFGLGSAMFAWLFFRSRCIPRPLAVLGIAGGAAVATCTLAVIVVPAWSALLAPAYYVPTSVFELLTSLWLLFRRVE